LSEILNGTQTQGEILPFYSRDLTFRLTVRDDQTVAGVDFDDVSFSVTDQAGPFVVEEFTGDYVGFSSATVNWEVNNTDIAPVNAEFVDIYVSTDGGITFSEKVAESTPNDGTQVVTLPNVTTATAKFKVTASNSIFFNISPGLFSITESTDPTFTISISNDLSSYCPTDEVTFTIESQSIFGYNQSIDLSIDAISGLSATFGNSTITPGASTSLTLTNNGEISGSFVLIINANSGSISKSVELPFTITNEPLAPTIITPSDQATGISLNPTISWDDTNIEATYNIEIASDVDFNNVIETGSTPEKLYSIQNDLVGSTTYFVRVNTENNCGLSGFDNISFTTAAIVCNAYNPTDLPLTIGSDAPNTIESTISIEATGDLEGIEVTNISGDHTYISDLVFRLVSPSGTEVVLLSNACGSDQNFNFSFSDDAESSVLPCPPTDGGVYQPESPLSAFLGEEIQGEWTLVIDDEANAYGGELQNWSVNFCVQNFQEPSLSMPTELTAQEAEDGSIILEWTDNADNETGYVIERSTGDNASFATLADLEINSITYTDNSTEAQTIYFYRVKAINEVGESGYSNEIEIETMISFPQAPTNLEISIENDYTAKLTWVDNASNETAYLVERSTGTSDFVQITELAPDAEAFEEVLEIAEYTYRILAANSRGNSEYSNEVSIGAEVLNTNEELLSKVLMFPNPAKEVVYIKNESNIQLNKVEIRNTLGQLINSEINIDRNQQIEIPIQNLSKGLYLIHIESNKGNLVKQLIIE
jgi:subtilisin-like proprotein convertase family protein